VIGGITVRRHRDGNGSDYSRGKDQLRCNATTLSASRKGSCVKRARDRALQLEGGERITDVHIVVM
jgi:hypothetical protein